MWKVKSKIRRIYLSVSGNIPSQSSRQFVDCLLPTGYCQKKRDILPIDSWKLAIVAATTVTTSFSINICHNKLFLSDRSVEKKNSWLCVKFIQTYCVCNGLSASLCVHGCWSAVELRRVDNITYTRGTHRVLRRLLQSNHNEVTREKMEKKQQQSTTHIKYTTIWRIL